MTDWVIYRHLVMIVVTIVNLRVMYGCEMLCNACGYRSTTVRGPFCYINFCCSCKVLLCFLLRLGIKLGCWAAGYFWLFCMLSLMIFAAKL